MNESYGENQRPTIYERVVDSIPPSAIIAAGAVLNIATGGEHGAFDKTTNVIFGVGALALSGGNLIRVAFNRITGRA